jgi:hypothetical protein
MKRERTFNIAATTTAKSFFLFVVAKDFSHFLHVMSDKAEKSETSVINLNDSKCFPLSGFRWLLSRLESQKVLMHSLTRASGVNN